MTNITTLSRMPMPAMLAELRTLYADTPASWVNRLLDHIEDLEAQLAAVGAGGVEPLRRRGCLHHIEEPLGMDGLVGRKPWKDGDTAALVNALRDVAVKYHATQQLRERIAELVHPLAKMAVTKAEGGAA